MTKKPSEKNKAWEKERRDRLNKTFDELAKLLPKYDPSVVWSKIEIIQKAITLIADLQKKQSDYLKSKDPELFNTYEGFVDCLKFYQERSAQLTELLKKAKVALPPVVLPQLLVDKPDLLPKEENSSAVAPPKPKRKRNRPKKTAPDVSAKNTIETATEKEEEIPPKKALNESVPNSLLASAEVAAKPTAFITALTREIPREVSITTDPPPPPLEPAKPFLLLRKPNSLRRLKMIPKPTFRKCYPHPDRMMRWAIERPSFLKFPPKRRRRPKKKRKIEPIARLEVEPIREQSVSPTAAFLLSFPVVTSSMLGGKNVENVESAVSLENLNNFFTTDEYSKFCDQNTVVEEKSSTLIPVVAADKPMSRGKAMTAFTVSAITRPSSPKKPIEQCVQVASKGVNDDPWIVENKFIRSTPATSFESCYNFTNLNTMMSSTNQQITRSQQTPTNKCSVARFSAPTAEQITSVKLEPANCTPGPSKSSSTGQFFPRYNHSSTMTTPNITESTAKAPNVALNSFAIQKLSVRADPPLATTCTSKSATSGCVPIPTQGVLLPENVLSTANCKMSSKCVPSTTTAGAMPKLKTKPSPNSFYSPTKGFFHDFPVHGPAADPLIAAKPQSFPVFPSIKTEFPWLVPNTNSFTTPSTATTMATTATACSLNTSFTPFDLASIVCESLTSTSFTFSPATAKSSEPVVVEAVNKQSSSNKCNQMNLFLPYEETQYMKPTDNQVYPTAKAKEISDQIFYDCEQSRPQQKSHVNWMTSPTTDYTPAPAAIPLPPIDFGNQFPASASFDYNFSCRKDSYDDDNQFINWSPTKPLNADFSNAYSYENFGSNEAPPNKTVKQIFSVSQLVDQDSAPMKKTKPVTQKSTPVKQTFSNIYSAESLIAKKDTHHMSNVNSYCNTDATNTQSDYHNTSNYFYNYANTQNCLDNDYLSASGYSSSASTVKTTSMLPSTASVIPAFDATASSSTGNYFAHTISSNTNDPYDPTYFPSSNYNHPTANWKGPPVNSYNQGQLYGTAEPPCQQNPNVSGNLTNFNLSSICPEIDGKNGTNGW